MIIDVTRIHCIIKVVDEALEIVKDVFSDNVVRPAHKLTRIKGFAESYPTRPLQCLSETGITSKGSARRREESLKVRVFTIFNFLNHNGLLGLDLRAIDDRILK